MIYLQEPQIFQPKFEIVSCICQCEEDILLLLRRDDKVEGNKWGLPAGKRELNEKLEDAVLREICEETGLNLAPAEVHYFNKVYVKYPDKDFIDHMFYADFRHKPKITISLKEHKDYMWKPFKKAMNMKRLMPGQAECFKLFYERTT